jgi:hypothetical protein
MFELYLNTLADSQTCHLIAQGHHHPGSILAGRKGARWKNLILALNHQEIRKIYSGCPDIDEDFIWSEQGILDFLDPMHFWRTELPDNHSLHVSTFFSARQRLLQRQLISISPEPGRSQRIANAVNQTRLP